MATADMISFEETRQAFAKTRARQQRHADWDRWLDGLEANMPDDPPSLEELTQAVFAMRQEWTGKIAAALVAQPHGRLLHQRTMSCPQCQCLRPARPAPPRTVHTLVGEVALCRPYCYCPHCQQGFAPLDDGRQRSERRQQWDMQQAGARLAVEVPFETAQELLAELTGLSLSAHTVPAVGGELSHELDVLEVSPTAAALAERVAELAAGQTWRPVLVLAIDGACVPTRPEEAKGFRFSLVDRERIVPLLSWYQVCRDEDVGAALRRGQEAGLIPEAQVRLGVIGDGATWIWNQVSALFPTAIQKTKATIVPFLRAELWDRDYHMQNIHRLSSQR